MNPDFRNYLLQVTDASACKEIEVIQSLWSGYGRISRYELVGGMEETVVVKYIALNQSSDHPRGWNTDKSHLRKVRSYEVETYWYQQWNQEVTHQCKTPNLIGSFSEGKDQWIILEDLQGDFPLRKYEVNLNEVKVCLKWLANFHVAFLKRKPTGLWKVGTYWHLDTRPDELEEMKESNLKSKAHLIDNLLNNAKYQTIVHGDAKLANFCFSENGKKVSAVDFQYVGGGCGIKDVGYFLGSCLSSEECEFYQDELLDFYFSILKKSFDSSTFDFKFQELETEWRKLYPIACTDFTRFLLGWMPSHQKVNGYQLGMMNFVLSNFNG